MIDLEAALRKRLEAGGRTFVPYVTGGFPGADADLLHALQDAGADAVEVGIPFSDPVMDGGVIQEASRRALQAGAHPADILELIADAGLSIPVVVMTYVNPVYRRGFEAFARDAVEAGVAGIIVPDLPVDEASEWLATCRKHDVASVLLASPNTAPDRLARIADEARGFVYCVASYGVTGAREELAATAREVVSALRPLTDRPLLVGVGVATPAQAAQACEFADGVIVGSAIMARLLEGDRNGAGRLASAFRESIPGV